MRNKGRYADRPGVGQAAVGLMSPKHSVNIGSVLRAAGCFGVSMVAVSGCRYSRSVTDTGKMHKRIPLVQCADLHDVIPYDCVPVAVELVEGAIMLPEFVHPLSAFYIFGPEDGTLGQRTLSWCKYVVQIPTHYCMNLAATVHVVLYDRMAKQIGHVGAW